MFRKAPLKEENHHSRRKRDARFVRDWWKLGMRMQRQGIAQAWNAKLRGQGLLTAINACKHIRVREGDHQGAGR